MSHARVGMSTPPPQPCRTPPPPHMPTQASGMAPGETHGGARFARPTLQTSSSTPRGFRPEGAVTYQPRASAVPPWVGRPRGAKPCKGATRPVSPFQGFAFADHTEPRATLCLPWADMFGPFQGRTNSRRKCRTWHAAKPEAYPAAHANASVGHGALRGFRPEGAVTYQPRASAAPPWVRRPRGAKPCKGATRTVSPLQGFAFADHTEPRATLRLPWAIMFGPFQGRNNSRRRVPRSRAHVNAASCSAMPDAYLTSHADASVGHGTRLRLQAIIRSRKPRHTPCPATPCFDERKARLARCKDFHVGEQQQEPRPISLGLVRAYGLGQNNPLASVYGNPR